MAKLFSVGAEGTNLIPYVPFYMGNDKAPKEAQIVAWYEPYSLGDSKKLQAKARKVSEAKDDEAGLDLVEDALGRVRILSKGLPGEGVSTDVPQDISDTLGQHRGLVEEIAMAVVASSISEPDALFFGWLATGASAV